MIPSKGAQRVVIVTGASGGLGGAMALEFASNGDRVVVNYNKSREAAAKVVEQINAVAPGVSFDWKADVSKYVEVEGMVQETLKRWNRIDVLVNNAGALPSGTRFPSGNRPEGSLIVETSEEEWDWYINSQLKGPFNCIKAVAPQMMKQKSGHIINIGGVIGFRGREGLVAYAAAKGGMFGLSRTAARELGQYNIKVNMAIPGPIPHPRIEWIFKPGETGTGLLHRDQTPEEFAFFVVTLSKLENVSGQVYSVENRIAL